MSVAALPFGILKCTTSAFFLSLRFGNKAEVWHRLIDNKKLPYMATIRNLRNLVLSGIDNSHVDTVCKYIGNEKAVINSRMFPFRFYTAFDVLDDLLGLSNASLAMKYGRQSNIYWWSLQTRPSSFHSAPRGRAKLTKAEKEKQAWHERKLETLKKRQEGMNKEAIGLFKKALDKAIFQATVFNIPPIKGHTLVLCAVGVDMNQRFSAQKGLV